MNIVDGMIDSIVKNKTDLQDRVDELETMLQEKNSEYQVLLLSHETLVRMLESRDKTIKDLLEIEPPQQHVFVLMAEIDYNGSALVDVYSDYLEACIAKDKLTMGLNGTGVSWKVIEKALI